MSKFNWGQRAYTLLLLCVVTAIASPAQTFKTLHSFDYADGANPDTSFSTRRWWNVPPNWAPIS